MISTQTLFTVSPELEIDLARTGLPLPLAGVDAFCEKHSDRLAGRGCYVFTALPPRKKRMTPIYVGETTRTFAAECFTPRNIQMLNEYLAANRTAEPRLALYLVSAPKKKGRANSRAIKDIERRLIEIAVAANVGLLNNHGTKLPEWGISGVLLDPDMRHSRGGDAQAFRHVMGLEHDDLE